MKRLFVLATVVVLLALLVSSVSAHIIEDPPEPRVVPTDVPSSNHVIREPPRPDPVSDGVTIYDKDVIVGDIDLDPT